MNNYGFGGFAHIEIKFFLVWPETILIVMGKKRSGGKRLHESYIDFVFTI